MGQGQVFLYCALFGLIGGALYELFTLLFFPLQKMRPFQIARDILFCLAFAALYVLFALFVSLPPLRLYHALGLFAGFLLWRESFHKTVAFFAKKIYNAIVRILHKRGKTLKWLSLKKRKSASR